MAVRQKFTKKELAEMKKKGMIEKAAPKKATKRAAKPIEEAKPITVIRRKTFYVKSKDGACSIAVLVHFFNDVAYYDDRAFAVLKPKHAKAVEARLDEMIAEFLGYEAMADAKVADR